MFLCPRRAKGREVAVDPSEDDSNVRCVAPMLRAFSLANNRQHRAVLPINTLLLSEPTVTDAVRGERVNRIIPSWEAYESAYWGWLLTAGAGL